MNLFKEPKEKPEEVKDDKKEFLSDMSYKVRNPLNAIMGIAEIVTRNIREDADKDQILMYMEILTDAAKDLHNSIDECFKDYEHPITEQKEVTVTEADFSMLSNLRVMVVEDSSVNQMVAKEILEQQGAKVTLCSDGHEAVHLFINSIAGSYDAILMDIKMPVMDGYEATDKIRNSDHPQASSIPIVAMTAETFAEDIQSALRAGMNAHISKPINVEKIVAALKSCM